MALQKPRSSTSRASSVVPSVSTKLEKNSVQKSRVDITKESRNLFSIPSNIGGTELEQPKANFIVSSNRGVMLNNNIPQNAQPPQTNIKILVSAACVFVATIFAIYVVFNGGPKISIQQECMEFAKKMVLVLKSEHNQPVKKEIIFQELEIKSLATDLNALHPISTNPSTDTLLITFRSQPFLLNLTFASTKYATSDNALVVLQSDTISYDLYVVLEVSKQFKVSVELTDLGNLVVLDIVNGLTMFRRQLEEIFLNKTLIMSLSDTLFDELWLIRFQNLPTSLRGSPCLSHFKK